MIILFLQYIAVIDGLAELVNERQKTCLDSVIKSRRVNK